MRHRASLRRRLRAAAVTAHAGRHRHHAGDCETVDELACGIVAAARELERELAAMARAPRTARAHTLDVVETKIASIEALAKRVALLRTDHPHGASASSAVLRDLTDRLDAIETARAEVATLEALLRFTAGPRPQRR